METSRWNLVIPEETNRSVRTYLASIGGKKGDLSKFVDRSVRQAVFWETVNAVQARNQDKDPDEIESLINEAVADVRADRS